MIQNYVLHILIVLNLFFNISNLKLMQNTEDMNAEMRTYVDIERFSSVSLSRILFTYLVIN